MNAQRINWLDHAKAISIMLVVMMHATMGVGNAMGGTGFMHDVVAFFTPFRIPAFFLLAGLLVSRSVGKPWSWMFDRKVLFYAYFYVLWLTIQFVFKAPVFAAELGWSGVFQAYAIAFIQPFGTLWFIAVLPVFYVIAKLTRGASPIAILGMALILHLAPIHTGWRLVDEVSDCLFYFIAGYLLVDYVFAFAQWVMDHMKIALAALAAWAVGHWALLDFASLPAVSVGFALAGTAALVATGVALRQVPDLGWLRWIGQNTLVIYLAFFLPMAVSRMVLVKLGIFDNVGVVSLLVWMAAVTGPIVMYFAIQWIGYGRFLFVRPKWFSLPVAGGKPAKLQTSR